jgi:pSer/pThr/pTyr-binding forkhead associated (FHA) protein
VSSKHDDGSSGSGKGALAQGDRGLAQPTVVSAVVSPSEPSSKRESETVALNRGPSGDTSRRDGNDGKPGVVATLTAIDGDLKGDTFVLHWGENHLGRGADCSPVLNSRWISRSHAILECDGDQMKIRAIEGKELAVNDATTTDQALHDGDLIRMGTTVLFLRTAAQGEVQASSVVRVETEGSAEHHISAAVSGPASGTVAAQANSSAPPPARRKNSWWKFWVKPAPSLVFISGTRTGQRFDLTGARVRIGGLQDNEIVISGTDASRNHAELRVRDGKVHIWDLRSVNGTWVNEEQIENKELRFGDVIRIGSEELRFED